MKLVKGSPEAKKFMAKIRAKKNINKKAPIKKLGNLNKESKNYIIENNNTGDYLVAVKPNIFSPNVEFAMLLTEAEANKILKATRGNIKTKLSGIKESNKLKKELKAKKLRLTHGYTTVKRKLSGIHKDTKIHNVNVSVISGVKIDNLKKIETLLKSIENFKSYKNTFKNNLKLVTNKADKTILRTAIKQMDRNIIHTNKTITQLKKLI